MLGSKWVSHITTPVFAQLHSPASGKPALMAGVCLLLTITWATTYAQNTTPPMPKKAAAWIAQANEFILYDKYAEAKTVLLKTAKKYPSLPKVYVLLGEVNWKMNNYPDARSAYQKLLALKPPPADEFMVHYALGQLWMEELNYDQAVAALTQCLAVKLPDAWKDKRTQADKLLQNARFAQYAVKHPVPFNPMRMDSTINSRHDEYLPMLSADEQILVFTRRFNATAIANEDFFYSLRPSDTVAWQMAIEMDKPINSPANEGAICISPDGKRLFFAAKDRPDSEGGFDLYYCYKTGEAWKGPFNLGRPINTPFWDSQPSIAADGKSLYFCSRRKGGHGGIDIWVSNLENNYWTEPVNLGANINTPGDEQSPFIHPDNQTLYFSSNGHVGMGNADLYVVRRDTAGNWGKPENLGYPINTPGTENGLVVNTKGNRAYYSSFAEGTGLDIFYFDLPKAAQPAYVTYVKGIVADDVTKKKLAADIELIDLETGKIVHQTTSDAINGEFLVTLPTGKNYMYNVAKQDYLFFSENFALANALTDKPYLLNIALKPIKKDEKDNKPVWNVGQSVVLKNVFFETDSYELKPSSFTELDRLVKLLQDYPNLKVEISGHTDNTGSKEHNQKLSANRAKAVYDYLTGKNIPTKQLTHKGYGDTKPIADNNTEAGRAANRRTEFTILDGISNQPLSQPLNGSSLVTPTPPQPNGSSNNANLLKNAILPDKKTPPPSKDLKKPKK